MKKGIVDRLEGGLTVVEWENGTMGKLPLKEFSHQPAEGDVFCWEEGRAQVLPDETERRKESVRKIFDRLKKM